MQNRTSTKKILIIASVLTVALISVYILVFLSVKAHTENASLLEEKVQLEQKRETVIRSIQNIVSNTGSDIGKLDSFFVGPDGVPGFIDSIEALARAHNLAASVGSVGIDSKADPASPKNKSSSPAITEILKLSLGTTGSWNNTFQFLSALESLPLKIKITSVDIVQSSGSLDPTTKKKSASEWTGAFSLEVLKLK